VWGLCLIYPLSFQKRKSLITQKEKVTNKVGEIQDLDIGRIAGSKLVGAMRFFEILKESVT